MRTTVKKMILSAAVAAAFISCRKHYTCSCSTHVMYPDQTQDVYQSIGKPYSQKLTKNQAVTVCRKEEKDLDSMYVHALTDNGQHSAYGISTSSSCLIQEQQ